MAGMIASYFVKLKILRAKTIIAFFFRN